MKLGEFAGGFPGALVVENVPASAGDLGLNPGSTSYSLYDLIHYEAEMHASFLQL